MPSSLWYPRPLLALAVPTPAVCVFEATICVKNWHNNCKIITSESWRIVRRGAGLCTRLVCLVSLRWTWPQFVQVTVRSCNFDSLLTSQPVKSIKTGATARMDSTGLTASIQSQTEAIVLIAHGHHLREPQALLAK